MEWVDALVSVTRWQSERRAVEWSDIERQFGTRLPADFKEICEVFGRGAFCGYLEVLSLDSTDQEGLLGRWNLLRGQWESEQMSSLFKPYRVFEETGLILWGKSMTEAQYYWLADTSTSPEDWPIVARTDPLEEWHRFDMSTAEFIYRVLTDRDFRPFSIARKVERPFYLSYR